MRSLANLPHGLVLALCGGALLHAAPAKAGEVATGTALTGTGTGGGAGLATGPASTPDNSDLNLILVDVTLDGQQLTDTLNVYELGKDMLVPVGELAQLLTIGVTVDEASHAASGFILAENRTFRLDPASSEVILPDGREPYDKAQVRWVDGDLYAPIRLLQRWWPVDLKLNLSALNLTVSAREKLPIQLRLEREKQAEALRGPGGGPVDPGYPRLPRDYRFASLPFIDNTLNISVKKDGAGLSSELAYAGYASGDLLWMEAAGYVTMSSSRPGPEARITLSRNDPDGGLLGPLGATSLQLGNVGVPSLTNVLRGAGVGWGGTIGNRPLSQSSSYGLQTLRGELPSGWDVTLYFNEALVGFQQSRADGLYEFADQPLVYGRNEFRLVFHGPLGQTRVEKQIFQLDQTLTKPGEFYYTLGGQRGNDGSIRAISQADFGVMKNVAATLGGVFIDDSRVRILGVPSGEVPRSYVNAGLRVAALGALFNADYVQDLKGGSLGELGVRTRQFGVSIDASHTWLSGFQSDFFNPDGDPLKLRDRLRFSGALKLGDHLRLPYDLDVVREENVSGQSSLTVNQRLSVNLAGTSVTNSLNWNRAGGNSTLGGSLQLSRRMAGISVSGQLGYALAPVAQFGSLTLSADKSFGENSRVSLGFSHDFAGGRDLVTLGVNRNFGPFGIGLTGYYGGSQNMGVNLQLFTALGRNPLSGRIFADWRPTAGMGMVAAHVFIDANQNGVYDEGEEEIENAGFTVNGSGRQQVKTDAHGMALLGRLPTLQYANVALETGTLEDVTWQPSRPGVRLLPRPGKALVVEFPIVLTAEIDGTVYLVTGEKRRGIGNAQLELVDKDGKVVSKTRSSSDGYYIVPGVLPGSYTLRIAPDQLASLKLVADRAPSVTVNAKADFVNGMDITLTRSDGAAAP